MPEKPQVPELPTKSSFYQALGHVLSEQLSAIKLERVKTQTLFKGEARNNSTGDLRSIIPKPSGILVLLCSN